MEPRAKITAARAACHLVGPGHLYSGALASQNSRVFIERALLFLTCLVVAAGCESHALDAHAGHGGSTSTAAGGSPAVAPPPFSSATLTPLYEAPPRWSATALDFDPARSGELWVTLRQFPDARPCNTPEDQQSGCSALVGQVALVKQAPSVPEMALERDGNGWHFLRRPTAIAFGDNGNLSTCGEARTDNYEDDPVDYAGPVLWSSDPAIFGAKPTPEQNGTHLDMLHETPYCMGIAHDAANAYFTFNGKLGAIDHYDFNHPHAIGGADHADGELARYVEGALLRQPEVPSQMAFDAATRELYVADTGHQRVVRLNVDTGTRGADIVVIDPMAAHYSVDGALLEEVVAPGHLELPSGLALVGEYLLVTDNATSRVHWFDRDGRPQGSLDTGLKPGSLAGIRVGPDGKLYLADLLSGNAYRVEMTQ
ncbi:MAG: hypothetical protein QM756_44215 [Polyangiaceae bacterium]